MPVAYVQLRPDAAATAEDLIAFCRDLLPERAAVPTQILFLPALPLTAVGKIAKPALRTDAMRRAVEEIALTTLGADGAPTVQIDETGRRPAAILLWPPEKQNLQAAQLRLKEACMGFTFEVRI
jgi:fatty-acyl-CoA synthase